MAEPAIEVRLGAWIDLRDEAAPIRYAVFVDEQKVPAEIELDDWDALSLHALALDAQGRVLGTGRLLPDGHIGRMAVLQSARGQGVGTALLRALLQAARARGDREVVLSAQTHAMPFYEKAGFIAEGDEYDDAGIPHRQMRLST
ncbi:MAG: GNAT family N-acetyltransferase [Burkholderiales bacterium]|jgi:predicted GNAT family N-acyltransferase|nr:GNAT family N-acetyltransferase [Burkholderiales bacterium]MCA3224304.1 GNAT family N-acetyltransferase [Burkholderiales bacterium]MCE2644157.1 GNAT family N-acetyltransferase [Burkholderiaceae bacterium]